MQYRCRNLKRVGWLILPLGVLLLLCTPSLRAAGYVCLRLFLVGGIVIAVSAGFTRRGASLHRLRDDLSDEEATCHRRLDSLKRQVSDVEAATREVRSEFRRSAERSRVEGARTALEERLRELKSAMARERAVLYSVDATRWQRRIEPLLRELEWLESDFEAADALLLEEWVQARLDRLNGLRPAGMRLQARLHTDSEAAALPAGKTMVALLRRELAEMEQARCDLLILRAELMACNRPWESAQPDPEFLVHRLKQVLHRIRTRRDERSRPQEPASVALRGTRTPRASPAGVRLRERQQGPPAAL
ncbi:MAG: hypothetical protein ACO1SX_19200 [Actinomycetota bacterium]